MLQVPNELIIGIVLAAAPSSGPEQWAPWPNQKEKKRKNTFGERRRGVGCVGRAGERKYLVCGFWGLAPPSAT